MAGSWILTRFGALVVLVQCRCFHSLPTKEACSVFVGWSNAVEVSEMCPTKSPFVKSRNCAVPAFKSQSFEVIRMCLFPTCCVGGAHKLNVVVRATLSFSSTRALLLFVLNLTCSTYTYYTCSRSLNLHSLTYAHMISLTQFTHKRSHTYSHSLNLPSLTFKQVHNLNVHFLSFTCLLHSLKCAVGPPWGCLHGRCSTLRLLMLHCVAGA